ncbi:MAG: DUF3298 domain-containing protein [Prevotella sp.]|nr:DUF3298 domain-containing protein [Prevotella sp.]
MKKGILLMAAAATMLLTACSKGVREQIDFEVVTKDVKQPLTEEKGAPECQLHFQILQAAGNKSEQAKAINRHIVKKIFDFDGDIAINAAVDSFANRYVGDYLRTLRPLYREERGDEKRHPWYEYRYSVTTEVQDGREGVAVYLITLDCFEGGAHGINQLLTLNFDVKTGKLLTLRDVFVKGYETPLNELLLEALEKHVGVTDLKGLRENDYLYSMDIFASEHFILGEDGITFVYNPYEIAPYAKGKTELTLSYDALKDLLQ